MTNSFHFLEKQHWCNPEPFYEGDPYKVYEDKEIAFKINTT